MYLHPNCEFSPGDLVELYWTGDSVSKQKCYGKYVFLDNERPQHLNDKVPIEFNDGPRFYRLYALEDNHDYSDIEYYDRPYWTVKKA